MNLRRLTHIDLNLLVTLQVLLEHRSVSVAASKLHLTQPAVSKALSRLRAQFDDPLFLRVSKGLVPTPFALAMQQPLQQWLDDAAALLVTDAFDPSRWKGEFNIAANDFLHMIVLPQLMELVSREAPGVVLKTRSQYRHQQEGLESGELDFVLNLEFSGLDPQFDSEVVYKDVPAIFARSGHPLRKKPWTREDLQRYPRVALRVPDMERLILFQPRAGQAPLSHQWPVVFETDNLTAALATVARTDFVLLGAGLLEGLATRDVNFKSLSSPTIPPFRIDYCLVSHQRVQKSAPHQWLRSTIRTLMQKLA